MTDIENQTFCIYCQKQFRFSTGLRKHVFEFHQGTYAHKAFVEKGYPPLNWRRKGNPNDGFPTRST